MIFANNVVLNAAICSAMKSFLSLLTRNMNGGVVSMGAAKRTMNESYKLRTRRITRLKINKLSSLPLFTPLFSVSVLQTSPYILSLVVPVHKYMYR